MRELKTSITSTSVRLALSSGCRARHVHAVERMRHVDDAPLPLDLGDRLGEGQAARDALLEEQADDLALGGLDLFADDHPHAVALGQGERLEAAGDLVVVGHGDDVEPYLGGPLEDLLDGHGAVLGVVGVHVEVGEQLGLEVAAGRGALPQAPADDVAVELHDLVGDDVPAVAPHGREAARGAGVAQGRVAQQPPEAAARARALRGGTSRPSTPSRTTSR
jgi:hypothetical protein